MPKGHKGLGSGQEPEPVLTAFISWAHAHFGVHPEEWAARVFRFAATLQTLGIAVEIDLAHLHDRTVDWSTFGVQGIESATYVLIVASSAYKERWEGAGSSRVGAGAAREANTLKSLFDSDREAFRTKVKVIMLPGVEVSDIPLELQSAVQRFRVESFDLSGLSDLLRTLADKPEWIMPERGALPNLPAKFVEGIKAVNEANDADTGTDPLAEDELRARLVAVEQALAETRPKEHEDLQLERSSIRGALQSLSTRATEPEASQRTPPPEPKDDDLQPRVQRDRSGDSSPSSAFGEESDESHPQTLRAPSAQRRTSIWKDAREVLTVEHPKRGLRGLGARGIAGVAFSGDGRMLATAGADKTARLWRLPNGREIAPLNHKGPVEAIAFGSDDDTIVTVASNLLQVWRIDGGLPPIQRKLKSAWRVTLTADGRHLILVTAPSLGTVRISVSDVPGGASVAELAQGVAVVGVAMSPDGLLLATANVDNTASVWDLDTGRQIRGLSHRKRLRGYRQTSDRQFKEDYYEDSVRAVAFSPDATRLATASTDHTARVWDIASSRTLHMLEHGDDPVQAVAFSPDGQLLATASGDHYVYIWDIASAHQVTQLWHANRAKAVAFSPDGRRIATVSADGKSRVWEPLS